MYILKNALVSIKRNKGRNILLAIIIAVISCACAVTLSIRNSANKIVASYESKNEIEATISMNRNRVMEDITTDTESQEDKIEKFNEIKSLTLEEVEEYGNSDYLKTYYYTYSTGMNSDDLEEATDKLEKETSKTTTTTKEMLKGPGMPEMFSSTTTTKETIKNANIIDGAFTLTGYSSYEAMNEFVTGSYTITEGTVDTDFERNSCVINSELAELNEISVGDTITLVNPDDEDLTYDLVVTGIYSDNDESEDVMQMYTNSVNNIITNANFVKDIVSEDEDKSYTITPTYILKNKDDFEKFSEELKEKGLSDYFEVSSNIERLEQDTKTITNIKTFATTFLIITLIIGGCVLLIINMINVRERKYEIGVLRTIGMKKSLVTCQFVIELLLVAIVGLSLGAAIGSLTSVPVANNLLANEIESAEEETNKIQDNFGRGEMDRGDFGKNNPFEKENTITQINEINAVVDTKVLLQLLAIGLGLTLISSMSAMVSIANFSPLKILKERS